MGIVRSSLKLLPALLLCSAITASVVHADAAADSKCRAAIGKNAAAFAQAKLKLLQKCNEALVKKGLPVGSCPDQKTSDKITSTQAKVDAAIVKSCAGKDKVCAAGGDDANPGFPATCPNFENGNCNGAIADCSGIGPCLNDCIGEAAVDQAVSLYYLGLIPQDPKAAKDANKCQLAISKSITGFFGAKSKALQKCWDTENKLGLKGSTTTACPPFGAGDGKAQAAIDKAKAKSDGAICKACGGADKLCDGNADIDPATLGFPSSCPPVTVPGTSTQACGGAITTMAQLRDCLDCVTEFKIDCISLAAAQGFPSAPAYPAECNVVLPATPTPTVTATVTGGGPTPTVTPTVTGGGPTATVTATVTGGGPTPTATSTPGGGGATCPTEITFTGTSTNGVLDTGWTGNGHDATVISNGTVSVSVSGCSGAAPNCNVCSYTGPIENTGTHQIHVRRCQNDSAIFCTSDGDCTGGTGPCKFFFGSNLPLAAGGVSTCVQNVFAAGITGTANVDTSGAGAGTSVGSASVTSIVFNGITLSNPCPQCNGDTTINDGVKGGTCSGGLHNGSSCDANGSSPNAAFGTTSLDCPPLAGAKIAALPINLDNTTGTKTRTLVSTSPTCRAPGWTALKCQCDTCGDNSGTVCATDSDCAAGIICGGKRCIGGANIGAACTVASQCPGSACSATGAQTAANQCDGGPGSGDCVADAGTPSPNDRICSSGPLESFCGPVETFRGCHADSECTRPGDTCSVSRFRDCFDNGTLGETVTSTGQADPPSGHQSDPTLAAMFCVGPTSSASVNSAAGLPGLGRLELQGHSVDNGTP
ncbi:MAG TPA: hypothetical protein VGK30_03970 [Candidatus Binatia bacterium]|jgi:hypothetical protein